MEKCIVFTDTLMLLITTLHGSVCKRKDCGCPLQYRKVYVGTCLVVSWVCPSGHLGGRWASQPSCNKIRAGNLTLASAVLLSGNSYTKVGLMFNFCNLQYFSSTLFNQYQQLYIIPAINEFWEQHKQQVWQDKRGTDTPGILHAKSIISPVFKYSGCSTKSIRYSYLTRSTQHH